MVPRAFIPPSSCPASPGRLSSPSLPSFSPPRISRQPSTPTLGPSASPPPPRAAYCPSNPFLPTPLSAFYPPPFRRHFPSLIPMPVTLSSLLIPIGLPCTSLFSLCLPTLRLPLRPHSPSYCLPSSLTSNPFQTPLPPTSPSQILHVSSKLSPVPAQVAHDSLSVRKRTRPTLLDLGNPDSPDNVPLDTSQDPIVPVKEVRFVSNRA